MNQVYWLYDDYDFDEEFLGCFQTMNEVKAACKKRDEETDGEWQPLLKKFKMCYQGNASIEILSVVHDCSY